MGISNRNINFRAPEQTHNRLRDLQMVFERKRTWVLNKAVDVLWTIIFDFARLEEFFHDWQVLMRKNAQAGATQLTLEFPKQDGYHFLPRIGKFPSLAAPDKRVRLSERGSTYPRLFSHPRVGVVLEKAAKGITSSPGALRRAFHFNRRGAA